LDIVLDPPRGIGFIEIGMPFDLAIEALNRLPGKKPLRPGRREQPGLAHYDTGLSIGVGMLDAWIVNSIEIWRPSRDVTVMFRGIDVFAVPASDLIEQFRVIAAIEVHDGGQRVVAPDLLLALWRGVLPENPEDEDGRYFQSVLVAKPGYYP
jgi:hypothetical protein